jgi:hypothetical protein
MVASSVSPKSVALAAGAAWANESPAMVDKINEIFFKSAPSEVLSGETYRSHGQYEIRKCGRNDIRQIELRTAQERQMSLDTNQSDHKTSTVS